MDTRKQTCPDASQMNVYFVECCDGKFPLWGYCRTPTCRTQDMLFRKADGQIALHSANSRSGFTWKSWETVFPLWQEPGRGLLGRVQRTFLLLFPLAVREQFTKGVQKASINLDSSWLCASKKGYIAESWWKTSCTLYRYTIVIKLSVTLWDPDGYQVSRRFPALRL